MLKQKSTLLCPGYYQDRFTICISNDYSVYSFGYSEHRSHGHKEKQINIPTQINNLANIKMIDCGFSHTICVDFDGIIYSFGSNEEGQLGIGKDNKELKQTYIPQKINLPPIKYVSCGSEFTICLSENNQLYSFGCNTDGQLGLGNNYDSITPQQIPNINNIEYIECGGTFTIIKSYNGEYFSWGTNKFGELGQGNYNECNKPIQCLNWPDNIIDIKSGYYHSLLLSSKGILYSFGRNKEGQLGINDCTIQSLNTPRLISDIPEIQRMECGYISSIIVDINNNIWVFGENARGQLGLTIDDIKFFKPIIHPELKDIVDISSGGIHSIVKTSSNKIYGFGENEFGQLGKKTSNKEQYRPIQILKDNEDIWCSFIGKSKQKSARK